MLLIALPYVWFLFGCSACASGVYRGVFFDDVAAPILTVILLTMGIFFIYLSVHSYIMLPRLVQLRKRDLSPQVRQEILTELSEPYLVVGDKIAALVSRLR